MRNSMSVPLALSLLLTCQVTLTSKVQAQSKTAAGHIEIINMKNPETIKMLDEQFIARPDENSVQQAIRLLALSIEAWNPSMQNTGTRQKLMGYVKEQGVLNGLVAPSMLLIERALKANKTEFAGNLVAMIRHISPQFYSQIPLNEKTNLFLKDFRSIVVGSDLQISGAMNSSLGASFSAYSQQYSGTEFATQKLSRPQPFSLMNAITINDSQSLILAAVSGKNTPEGLRASIVEQCKSRASKALKSSSIVSVVNSLDISAFEQNEFGITDDFNFGSYGQKPAPVPGSMAGASNWLPQKPAAKNRCDELRIKRLNPNAAIEEQLKQFAKQAEMTQEKNFGWVTAADCAEVAANILTVPGVGSAQDPKVKSIEAERAKYADGESLPQNSCLGTCVNSVDKWGGALAVSGAVIGTRIGGMQGGLVGGVVGAIGGVVVGVVDCRASKQCGGDPVYNAQQAAALQKVIDDGRIRDEQIRAAEAKRRQAESEERVQRAKEQEAARERSERERKQEKEQNEKRDLENKRLAKELAPVQSKARTGGESCNGSGCGVSNTVDGGSPEFQFQMALKKEQEQAERMRNYYARTEGIINAGPDYDIKRALKEGLKEDEEYRKCLEKDSTVERDPYGDLFRESVEEQRLKNAERLRQERENRTTPTPKKPWEL